MKQTLHVLIIEDSDDDAQLMTHELTRSGYRVISERVQTAEDLRRELARGWPELVLSDYAMPGFDGEAALHLVREVARDIPFIFVSGTMGEDIAVEAMKAGAHDYVMKGNLARLVPAIERELRDATERRQHRDAEKQMRMSEHKYRHLFRSMGDAALLIAEETEKIIDANEQAEILFGQTREEMLGLTSTDLYPLPPGDKLQRSRDESTWDVPGGWESIVQRRNGSTVPVHICVSRIQLYDRPFLLTLFRDISKRKQAETSLRSVLRHARTIVMHGIVTAPDGWQPDASGWSAANFQWQFRFQDEAAAREVLPLDVPVGKAYDNDSWNAAKHPDDREPMTAVASRAFASGASSWQQEFRSIDRDGRVHWFTQAASIEATGHGRWRVTTINTDITDRKLAEEALRTSEERLSTVFHLSPTGICIVRVADNRFVEANEAFINGTGYTRDEIIGRTPAELHLWENPEDLAAIMNEVQKKGTAIAFKVRGRRKSGEIGVGLTSMTKITLNGAEHFLSLIQDFTEFERAEEARRESDQRFRQLAENIDEVFWLTDVNKNQMIYISQAYPHVWGRSCESIYAAPRSWLDAVHAEDHQRVHAALDLQATGNYDLEYRIVRPDGAVRWIHERAFPVKDTTGKLYRIAGVASDITVRRDLEEQFRQAQKMEAVGQLAGGVAHDFNNVLTVIQMQSSILLADLREHGVRAGIEQIMDASKRAATLVRQLLAFSRRQTQAAQSLDLVEVVGNMAKMLRRILGEDIRLESRFAPALPHVLADAGMMEQVLMNLVINARDAMPGGGRLIISLDTVSFDAAYAAAHPSASAGRFVCLAVGDTGEGIPPEIRARIFEPFFTTKEVGKGTGLGLATVFGIVQQHRGWIDVESEIGVGTTFRMFLPALENSTALIAPADHAPEIRGGTETILLVEDDTIVRCVTGAALRQRGYRVLEAGTAAEAVMRWDEMQGKVDLLVTDLIIPGGVSGNVLAEQLLVRRPSLRIVYITGYSAESISRQLKLEPGKNYLEKPYSLADLAAIVRRCLNEW